MILRFWMLLALAGSLFLLQQAAAPIVEQNRKVRQWPGVDVTAVGRLADPPATRPRADAVAVGAPSAAQDIHLVYRYEVNGVVIRLPRFTPTTKELAPLGSALFENGESSYALRGHYDPQRPQELLIPTPFGFRDYWQIFFWGPIFGVAFGGLVMRRAGYSGRSRLTRSPETKGWPRLKPKYSIRHRASGAWGVATVTCVIAGVAAYDYFEGTPRTHSPTSNFLVTLGLLPGVLALGLAAYYTWLATRVGDARVSVDRASVAPGGRLIVKVELPAKSNIELERVRIGLACVRSELRPSGFRRRVIWEEAVDRDLGGRRAQSGAGVSFEQRFHIPPDALPTDRGGFNGPWTDWEIRVHFQLDGGPDYRGAFAVVVEAEHAATV